MNRKRQSLIEETSKRYEEGFGLLRKEFFSSPTGIKLCKQLTELTDTLLAESFRELSTHFKNNRSGRISLIALGGYGRGLLSPFSDIDILLLHNGELSEEDTAFIENFISFLWDIKMKPGSTCRSVEECITACNEDITIKTSFLEARYITGDKELFHTLQTAVQKRVISQKKKEFFLKKQAERKEKRARFGENIKVTNPNLKEGSGGLRDHHTILWYSIVLWNARSDEEIYKAFALSFLPEDALEQALELILKMRNGLHFLTNKPEDALNPVHHRSLAVSLLYQDSLRVPAEVQMMREYYESATVFYDVMTIVVSKSVKLFHKMPNFINKVLIKKLEAPFKHSNKRLFVDPEDLPIFETDPVKALRIPHLLAKHSLDLSNRLKVKVKMVFAEKTYYDIAGAVKKEYLCTLLKEEKCYKKLRILESLGVFPLLLFGYKEIESLVYYDVYHLYTVDEHTLQAIRFFEEIPQLEGKEYEPLQEVYNKLNEKWKVKLALLFHDIGKTVGRTHIRRGLQLLSQTFTDWEVSEELSKEISFLVDKHIFMSATAQRRDIYDARTLKMFLMRIPSQRHLNMLYLLTYADMAAVAPGFVSSWKINLINELYRCASESMASDASYAKQNNDSRLELRSSIINYLKKKDIASSINSSQLDEFIKKLPQTYINYTPPERVIKDYFLLTKIWGKSIVELEIWDNADEDFSELTICSENRRGLFKNIMAVLYANGININGAYIYTDPDGWVLDTLHIGSVHKNEKIPQKVSKKLTKELTQLLQGELSEEELLKNRKSFISSNLSKNVKSPTLIKVVQDGAADHSILEVIIEDIPGISYEIAKILFNEEVDINACYLALEGNRAVNSYYISRNGKRIEELDFESKLRTSLSEAGL